MKLTLVLRKDDHDYVDVYGPDHISGVWHIDTLNGDDLEVYNRVMTGEDVTVELTVKEE